MKEYTPKIRLLVAHLGNGYIEIALEGLTKTIRMLVNELSETNFANALESLQSIFPSDHPNMVHIAELLEKAKKANAYTKSEVA